MRGGGQTVLSFDAADLESRYEQFEPVDKLTPERIFAREWAVALIRCVLDRFRDECVRAEKARFFEVRRACARSACWKAFARRPL